MADQIKLFYHPEYEVYRPKWAVYDALSKGEHDTLSSAEYLWMHELESVPNGGNRIRELRQQRSRYTNYAEVIISTYVAMAFKQEPDISEVESLFGEEELKDVDGSGNSLFTFVKRFYAYYTLFGRSYILTDSLPVEAPTQADSEAIGQRPFWELYTPLEVPDWQRNDLGKGKYRAFRYEYQLVEPRASLQDKPESAVYSKELYLRDSQYFQRLYKQHKKRSGEKSENWELIDEKLIPSLQELPVASLEGDSWLKDVSELLLRHHNIESWLDTALYYHGYPVRYVTGVTDDGQKKAMAAYTLLFLPEGSTAGSFLPADTGSLERRKQATEAAIYKAAFNLTRLLPTDSAQVEAADTQREGKEALISQLVSSLAELEDAVNLAIKHYAAFKGQPSFNGKVSFNKDITPEDIDLQLRIFAQTRDRIALYPTWQKEWDKKAAHAMKLPNMEEIEKEIDAGVLEPQAEEETRRDRLSTALNG